MSKGMQLTREEYDITLDEQIGFCTNCGTDQNEVAPDAQNLACSTCGSASVFGTPVLAAAGKLVIA